MRTIQYLDFSHILGRVVQSWITITQGKCDMKAQKTNYLINYFCVNIVHWMLDKEFEKTLQQNAFNPEKKKPGLKFCPGLALIGL